ncbi:hypothetical protein B0H19DRAFT_1121689 [Mycena capillaripes]|nr:hypothetical protein B0H19DRAFT_1121689 [Mycena capillaripes]
MVSLLLSETLLARLTLISITIQGQRKDFNLEWKRQQDASHTLPKVTEVEVSHKVKVHAYSVVDPVLNCSALSQYPKPDVSYL